MVSETIPRSRRTSAERGFLEAGTMMRELAIIITAFVALSAMTRGNGQFVPRPTGPMPAVNVP
jgi:hypothetical protein